MLPYFEPAMVARLGFPITRDHRGPRRARFWRGGVEVTAIVDATKSFLVESQAVQSALAVALLASGSSLLAPGFIKPATTPRFAQATHRLAPASKKV